MRAALSSEFLAGLLTLPWEDSAGRLDLVQREGRAVNLCLVSNVGR